jgi:hypothetical protein
VTEAPLTDGQGDGDYRVAVTDLLGLLAYAELVAFFQLSDDAALAPSIADKAALGRMAVAEFSHFGLLWTRLEELGADPEQAMRPFAGPLESFHAQTAPGDWLEGLVKAYVGDGLAADFYGAVAEFLDPRNRELVLEVLADTGHAEFAVERVRRAIQADRTLAGRLALWARRLVGEALSQAQRVAAQRDPLLHLLAGQVAAPDAAAKVEPWPAADGRSELGEIGRLFARITDAHTKRMAALGLDT